MCLAVGATNYMLLSQNILTESLGSLGFHVVSLVL